MVTFIFELTEEYTAYLSKVRETAKSTDYTYLAKKSDGNTSVPASDVLSVIGVAQACAGNIFQYTVNFRQMMDGVLLESQNRNLGWILEDGTASKDAPDLIAQYIDSKNSGTQDKFTQMVGKYYAPSNICGDYEPAKGDKGERGEPGLTPEFSATAVSGDSSGVTVDSNITDSSYKVTLNFTLPKGRDGENGKTPTIRYNKNNAYWEYTIDGGQIWTKVEGSESLPSIEIKITDLRK